MAKSAAAKTITAKPAKAAAAKKPAAKAKAAKPAAKAAAKKGAAAAAAELAAEPTVKAKAKKGEAEQVVATPELQAIADQVTEISGELGVAKGVVNEIDGRLKTKKQELLDNGAIVGMIFEISGDPMQFTHNVTPSTAYSKLLAELGEAHPELAEEIEALKVKHTKGNQQAPNFKAA